MKGRIKFHREDGTIGESPGCGSILVAFGEENAEILRSSNIEGRYIQVNQEPCNTHVDWEQRRNDILFRKIKRANSKYTEYLSACDKVAKAAQKHINWNNNVGCAYIPGDGLCVEIEAHVCPVTRFFELPEIIGNDMIDEYTYRTNCI